jgi:hypothetical protein
MTDDDYVRLILSSVHRKNLSQCPGSCSVPMSMDRSLFVVFSFVDLDFIALTPIYDNDNDNCSSSRQGIPGAVMVVTANWQS